MASALSTDKLQSRLFVAAYDHDPGGTSATIASPDGGTTKKYVDMRDYCNLLVCVAPSVIAGSVTKVEIVAATDAAFTSPVVVKDSGTVAADANGDYVIEECSTDDLVDAGTNLRYAAARVTHSTGTDESVVFYVATPKNPADGTSATTIA